VKKKRVENRRNEKLEKQRWPVAILPRPGAESNLFGQRNKIALNNFRYFLNGLIGVDSAF
jgi:hypothetical protein